MSNIKKGAVLGIATVGVGKYSSSNNNDAYDAWSNMIHRCYAKQNLNKSYLDCYVCKEWLNFQNFAQFYYEDAFRKSGWQLDKDILCKGNVEYSPDKCVFTPPSVNKMFVKRKLHRGDLPIGVYYDHHRKKYKASMHDGSGRTRFLGRHDTPEEAFTAYKEAKEALIVKVAENHKSEISPKLYNAMINYKVNYED